MNCPNQVLLKKFLVGLFFGLSLLVAGVFVFKQTAMRVGNELSKNQTGEKLAVVENLVPDVISFSPKSDSNISSKISEEPPRTQDVWCTARDYEDLASHEAIVQFDRWLEDFKSLSCETLEKCEEHDPRTIFSLLQAGEKLAIERKPIFSQIIRGDPKKALQKAVPQRIYQILPNRITKHLEK